MSDKKSNVQLEEELIAVKAELDEVSQKLANTKETAVAEVQREKDMLRLEAEGNEKIRQDELEVATAGYEALSEQAAEIYANQVAVDPSTLGTAGKLARDGIMNVLTEIFGEL